MAKFNFGDRVKVLDRPGWSDGGYKIGNWEGKIMRFKKDPVGWVVMKADKTGYNTAFPENELELIHPNFKMEQISSHDGTLVFRCIAAKKPKETHRLILDWTCDLMNDFRCKRSENIWSQ